MEVRRFRGRDGLELAYREIGSGRPLVLLHGFTGDSAQWIDSGPARLFADHGFRVILPDLRGHGRSAHLDALAGYRPDVLADDGLALVEQLGDFGPGGDYDLGGCSLGGRVVLRMLARGARPGRAIVACQGLTAVTAARANGLRDVLTAMVNGGQPSDAQAAIDGGVPSGGQVAIDGGPLLGGQVAANGGLPSDVQRAANGRPSPGFQAVVDGGPSPDTQGVLNGSPSPGAQSGAQPLGTQVAANGGSSLDAGAAYWIRRSGNDPEVLLRVLDTHVPTPEAALRQITTPTLVMIGDQDNANADELAAALPDGQFVRVPGDHYTSLGSSEFAEAALGFLKARRNVTHASTAR